MELLAPEDREKVKQMIDAWNAELRAATAADQPQPPVQPPTAPTVTGSSEDDDKAESASESEEDDDDVRPLPFLASIAPDGRSKCQYVHCPTREIRADAATRCARDPIPATGRQRARPVVPRRLRLRRDGVGRHELSTRSGPPDGLDALSPPDRARLLRLVADAKKRRRKADNGSERSVKQKSSSSGDAQPPAAPPPMSLGPLVRGRAREVRGCFSGPWARLGEGRLCGRLEDAGASPVRTRRSTSSNKKTWRTRRAGPATRRARRSSRGPSQLGRRRRRRRRPNSRTRRRC